MDLNEGQKSLGRTVVTAEECEKVAVDSTPVLSSRCEAIRCEGRVFYVAGTSS